MLTWKGEARIHPDFVEDLAVMVKSRKGPLKLSQGRFGYGVVARDVAKFEKCL
jgi:hypothetical protein